PGTPAPSSRAHSSALHPLFLLVEATPAPLKRYAKWQGLPPQSPHERCRTMAGLKRTLTAGLLIALPTLLLGGGPPSVQFTNITTATTPVGVYHAGDARLFVVQKG